MAAAARAARDDKMSVAAEAVGIVISSGKRDEAPPAFRAYVWGPAPEDAPAPFRPGAKPKAA